ncbi:MAG: hypothetical protein LC790_01405, partial [Actinobacteria bacterium]|nr:hypothetical protein [Actinomycetota bacterium]
TRSYVCVNTWAYAVHPSRASAERARLAEPAQLEWRNELRDRARRLRPEDCGPEGYCHILEDRGP